MMKKILLFLLLAVFSLGISAQAPSKKCPVCGLSIPTCQYKGKHPKKKPTTSAQQQPSKPAKPAAKPRPTTGTLNGYDWVDLGLSVKWATKNVGADSPSDYGGYFAWGEISTKSSYTKDNSKTYNKPMGDIAGNSQYDTARANWGSTWRMPTEKEFQELSDQCTWTWTSQGGHAGYRVTSKTNGNSIFLPAAGYRDGQSLHYVGSYGHYWSAGPNSITSGRNLSFIPSYVYPQYTSSRAYGLTVRPVSE